MRRRKMIFATLRSPSAVGGKGLSLVCGLILSVASSIQAADGAPGLKQIASINLPGPPAKRFDYLVIDYDDGWLFSAHLAANQTYVIDLKSNEVLHTIADTPGAEGLEYVPDERKIYTSNAGDNTIGVVDLKTMKVVHKIPTERKPDGSTYVAAVHKLYVSDEIARAVAVVDVRSDKIVTTLHFDSETGVPTYDPGSKLVYVNLQDRNELAAIDPKDDQIVARYPVEKCRGNHGMALDAEHHRAFLACEGNRVLVVFDLDAHKVIDSMPLAAGPDVVQFDPGIGRVYVGCASGAISVFQEDDPDHFRKLADVPVQRRVHSLAVDTRTHRVYAPAQEEEGRGVARMLVFDAVLDAPAPKP
jgi:YVTN family beta-propeller protein